MGHKVRVNQANPMELQELPGVGPAQADAIVKFRAAHGPITEREQLSSLLGGWSAPDSVWERVDFDPADDTAPEAPGA